MKSDAIQKLIIDLQEELIHQEARELMSFLDKKYNRHSCYSLDEYLAEFTFTEYEECEILDLLEKFNDN